MDGAAVGWRSERAIRALDVAMITGIVVVGWAGMVAARTEPDVEAAALTAPMAVAAIVVALPLWWRRQRPLGMLAAVIVGIVVAGAIEEGGLFSVQVLLEAAVLCFAIGAWARRLWLAAGVLGSLIALIVLGAAGDGSNVLAAGAYGVAIIALPAVAGYATRTRRRYLEEVEQRLADAERDRDVRARRAVLDERTRIARELHDVVAHHVSLIGVQAGAARVALDRSPDQTRAALDAIAESSRAAVGEMRQLLDALAPLPGEERSDPAQAPQPALTQLPTLVERWSAAGVHVDLTVVGDLDAVSLALSLCCYRIIEEALTNVARHAPVPTASVAVDVEPDVLRIVVTDPARIDPDADPVPDLQPTSPNRSGSSPLHHGATGWTQNDGVAGGGGRGLVGMRERVALFGGELVTGPTDGGGFEVRAVLPRDRS